jgi:hypothetical protein
VDKRTSITPDSNGTELAKQLGIGRADAEPVDEGGEAAGTGEGDFGDVAV